MFPRHTLENTESVRNDEGKQTLKKKISKSISEIFNPTTKSHFQYERERHAAPYTFIPP